jgi:hypothetical protein
MHGLLIFLAILKESNPCYQENRIEFISSNGNKRLESNPAVKTIIHRHLKSSFDAKAVLVISSSSSSSSFVAGLL